MLPLFTTIQAFGTRIANRLRRDETGATAVEYGIMVGLIAVVIIVIVSTLGGQLAAMFQEVSDQLGGATPATDTTTTQ